MPALASATLVGSQVRRYDAVRHRGVEKEGNADGTWNAPVFYAPRGRTFKMTGPDAPSHPASHSAVTRAGAARAPDRKVMSERENEQKEERAGTSCHCLFLSWTTAGCSGRHPFSKDDIHDSAQ